MVARGCHQHPAAVLQGRQHCTPVLAAPHYTPRHALGPPAPLTVAEGDAQAHEEGDDDQPKAGAVRVNEGEPEDATLYGGKGWGQHPWPRGSRVGAGHPGATRVPWHRHPCPRGQRGKEAVSPTSTLASPEGAAGWGTPYLGDQQEPQQVEGGAEHTQQRHLPPPVAQGWELVQDGGGDALDVPELRDGGCQWGRCPGPRLPWTVCRGWSSQRGLHRALSPCASPSL